MVGVVPAETPAGRRYAIMDSWDSSGRTIGDYFVLRPEEWEKRMREEQEEDPPKEETPLLVQTGERLVHPRFGEGMIEAVQDGKVTVIFPDVGRKTLTVAWVQANCKAV